MKYLSTLIFAVSLLALSNCDEEEVAPEQPELVSPAEAASNADLNLTFNWNPVDGARSYSFQLSLSPDFTETLTNLSGIEEVSITVPNLMPDTKYYWRVDARNDAGISPWSEVRFFTTQLVGIPLLSRPENNAVINDNQITLSWNPVDADSYTVQVARVPDFSSMILNSEDVADTSLNVTDLQWAAKYYWRVRAAKNSCGSEWSATWSFQIKRQIPTAGLVAFYPFNGNANDESGNAHDGTVEGAVLWRDRKGEQNRAYLFDGVDDYIWVTHHDALNLMGDFSISVWYKSDGCLTPCGTYHTIINKRDESVAGDNWPWGVSISYVSGTAGNEFRKIFSSRRNSLNLDYQVSESEILLNTWQHLVIVTKDSVESIYIDGRLDGTYHFVQEQMASTERLLIGWNLRPDLEQFKGSIDDIRLYNRALTGEEILALFEE